MNTSTKKGSDIMSKKTIIAGIMSIMMLGAVPAFAATPQNSEIIPSQQHISAHTDHHRHHKEEVKPHHHKEVKQHHHRHHNHYQDYYHKHHNSDTIDETTRGRGK